MSEIDLGIDGLADIETIGRGGSAAVYRARQVALDRVVAVKVLMSAWDTDVRKRFDRECRSMGKLSDDIGVVPIYESGETSTGAPYIVMPYYPAGSLQDEMNRNGAYDWRIAATHMMSVAKTIGAANESGVIHRDIKPANLLLGNDGRPRVSDFGIARLVSDEQLASHASTPLFTPAYCSPESFSENSTAPTVDVYGLGSTFWALLAGHAPFKKKGERVDMLTVFSRVANEPVGDLRSTVPAPICELVERAMAKSPADRPQNAFELIEELDIAVDRADREPIGGAAPTIGNFAESTVSLSRPAEEAPAGLTLSRTPRRSLIAPKPEPEVERPPSRIPAPRPKARVDAPKATPSRTVQRRPSASPSFAPERPPTILPKASRSESGTWWSEWVAVVRGTVTDVDFWRRNASKISMIAISVLAVVLVAAFLFARSSSDKSVSGKKTENSQGAETGAGGGPQLIGLNTVDVTETSATIEFSTDECVIVQYLGAGIEAWQSPGWPDSFDDCATQHRHSFDDLTEGTSYTVVIEARNDEAGVTSDTIEFTAGFDAVEEAPTVAVTTDSATIRFTTSTCTVAEFTGEELVRFAEPGWPDANVDCSEDHEHTFTDLQRSTRYTAEVNILDRENRRTSIPVEFTTPATNRLAISNFVVSRVTDTEATVSFSTSKCADARFFGSAGTFFEDGWNNGNAKCSTRHSFRFTALKPGTEYSVEVEARDEKNSSESVRSRGPLVFTTNADENAPTIDASVASTGSTSAVLSIATSSCSVVRVTVAGQSTDSGDWLNPSESNCSEQHQVTIQGLGAGEEYVAEVRAKGLDGAVSAVQGVSFTTEASETPTISALDVVVDENEAAVTFVGADCDTYVVTLSPASGTQPQIGDCGGSGASGVTFRELPRGSYTVNVTLNSPDGGRSSDSKDFEITAID